MADFDALPDLEQAVATFRTAFADILANKVNENPNYGEADARTRVVAEWGDFIDGAIAQLQDDYAERRVTGILRLGASRVYRVEGSPEGAQTGNVGDIATDATNGVAYIKETGTGNTGWTVLTSGAGSLPSLAEDNVWLGNASNVATATTRAGVDSTAVHVGTAGEIASVSGVAPAAGDYLLAEDVDDANNKIRVTAAQIAALGLTVSGTDHRAVRMDGTDGIQDSAVTIDDSGNVLGVGTLTTSGTITVGASTIAATDGTNGQVLTSNGAGAWTMQDAPGGVDATAVHTDGSGEIAGVSPITVATGDYVLVEDVGSGNAKGRVTAQAIANLADHDALTNFVANEHIDWTASSAGTIDPTNYVPGGPGTDTTAIHTDEAGEIQGLTVVAPAANDLLVAEDFSNSYNKIRVTTGQVSTLAVGVSSDNRLARYNGSQAVQGSGITVSDADALSGVTGISGGTGSVGISGATGNWAWSGCQKAPATNTQSPAGDTITIDWNTGNFQRVDLGSRSPTNPLVFTLSNPVHGSTYRILIVLPDDGETHTTSWPSNCFWDGGTISGSDRAPGTLTTAGDAATDAQLVTLTYSSTDGFYIGGSQTVETS